MKFPLVIILSMLLLSCAEKTDEWRTTWSNHGKDFKQVANLLRQERLSTTPAGTSYIIPDSINLKYPCDQKVMKLDDQNKDTGLSCLFLLDTAQRPYRKNPVLVYTTNAIRKRFYEKDFKDNVIKIEANWYFMYN